MEGKSLTRQNSGLIRTIITNAVYGRAIQTCQTTIYINSNENKRPNKVLGCTITGAQIDECKFEAVTENNMNIRVEGKFEVHVWYELNNDTYVAKSNEKFSEVISVESLCGECYRNKQILAWIGKKPTSTGTMIVNRSGSPSIAVQVEYELGVEVIGEAKLNIVTYESDKTQEENDGIIVDSLTVFNNEI